MTLNQDITRVISCFATEEFLTNKMFRALHELFSGVRSNGAKLIQKNLYQIDKNSGLEKKI